MLDAIVLAGGKPSPEMLAATGVSNRALVELTTGRTMLDYIVAALRDAHSVDEIHVVGDVGSIEGVEVLAPGHSLVENLMRGLGALRNSDADRALLVSADIPFISGAAVDDFIQLASDSGADLCYPIIPMADYKREFAGMKRTTLDIAEGSFTGGNIMLVSPMRLLNNRANIEKSYAARKDVFALGRMLGAGLLARIVLSRIGFPKVLKLATLEAGVSRLLGPGARAQGIVTRHPSIGTDVDKPDDVAFAREWFAQHRTGDP